jgi:two-component system response regulator FixJ
MPTQRVVYIVDDDAGVRRSLERLLAAAGFGAVSYASAAAFLGEAAGLPAGCALVDLRMPEMDGIEVQERLKRMHAELPVIVVTGQADVLSAVRAMKAGAADFIEKPYSDEILLGAIEAALSGGRRGQRGDDLAEAARRIAHLSPREREVLDALAAGQPNKVIAFNLGISVRTVEVHRSRMMDRLGVQQFADAVRLSVLAKLAGVG